MKLHRATVEDVPRILECAREFTSIIPDCKLDESHYVSFWASALQSGMGNIILLIDEGRVVGGIGGIKHPDLLTCNLTAVELFWYVKVNYRRGTWPVRLLREFEVWAALQGCVWISMIHEECSMPAKLHEFYVKAGYHKLETVYRKRIKS